MSKIAILPPGIKTITEVKKGRRRYGARYLLDSGKRVYLAHRKPDEFFKNGHATIAEAMRHGALDWALDFDTVLTERTLGTTYLGVLVKGTGEIWLTHTHIYADRRFASIKNYTGRGGSVQCYLNTKYFVRRPGIVTKL